MSSTSMLDSGKLGNFDEPSTSLNPYFVGNMATDSAVIDAANAWECYLQQKRDRDRDRSGEHGHDKRRRRRCRDRGKQSSSSSHNSGRKQMKHRESTEHVYKRCRIDGASGKKKQKEEKDGSQKPSQRSSNFSGKDDRKKRSSQKKGKDGGRPQKATLPAKMEN
ncbi:splicing factor U2af large subunit B-like [Fundulus heteroclitus]|uniref:splicing factor U2af large subunit B-like n=1 Tax=Fundulus heteroclitus TaxID=8078 RepID=UPI00165BC082|nr:splicing factor U2af large subunit B-like [Fundulus heteroclitus]